MFQYRGNCRRAPDRAGSDHRRGGRNDRDVGHDDFVHPRPMPAAADGDIECPGNRGARRSHCAIDGGAELVLETFDERAFAADPTGLDATRLRYSFRCHRGEVFVDGDHGLACLYLDRSASCGLGVISRRGASGYSVCISTLRSCGLDVYSRRGASCYSICISTLRVVRVGCLFTTRSVLLLYLYSRPLRVVRVWVFVHDAEGRSCYSICISTPASCGGCLLRRGASCYSICILDAPAFVRWMFGSRRGSVVLLYVIADRSAFREGWVFVHDGGASCYSILYLTPRVLRLMFVHRRGASLLLLFVSRRSASCGWMFIHDAERRCYSICILDAPRRAGWMFVHARGASVLTLFAETRLLNIKLRHGKREGEVECLDATRRATTVCHR